MKWNVVNIAFLAATVGIVQAQLSKVDRPRGVSLTKKVFYDPNKNFACFDGSRTIPFSQVNDDYCDCNDGSDEPGTSACPNGQFHCTNAGYRPLNIPSSRVNDGICDCCDGSDEWKTEGLCTDTCKELWKAAREYLQKQAAAASRGIQVRKEYSDRGIALRNENQKKLETMKIEIEEIKRLEDEIRIKKEETEQAEAVAKDTEQTAWNDFKSRVQKQQESRKAADAFTELDSNKDGSISVEEMKSHTELDTNLDGVLADDEIKALLGGDMAEAPYFIENTWKIISEKYISRPTEPVKAPHQEIDEEEHHDDDHEDDDLDEEEDDDDYHDEEDLEDEGYDDDLSEEEEDMEMKAKLEEGEPQKENSQAEQVEQKQEEKPEEIPEINLPSEPVWTDNTKALIEAAEKTRREHEEQQKRKKDLEREIASLEKNLKMDFGNDQAYKELQGKCFDLDTHEYTYRICPFDKTVQKPKGGGSETSLGRWGSWSGPETSKYSAMKYTGGVKCWNGPDRSTEVRIACGDENKLLSASEPSRCEYRFEFVTPAACEPIHVPDAAHDEL
ncbi:glucosidase 2 subunit beta-like [Styela clava]